MALNRQTYSIDSSHPAKSCDQWIKHLVLHYTAGSFQSSLDILTHGEVSAHYLVPDKEINGEKNKIY